MQLFPSCSPKVSSAISHFWPDPLFVKVSLYFIPQPHCSCMGNCVTNLAAMSAQHSGPYRTVISVSVCLSSYIGKWPPTCVSWELHVCAAEFHLQQISFTSLHTPTPLPTCVRPPTWAEISIASDRDSAQEDGACPLCNHATESDFPTAPRPMGLRLPQRATFPRHPVQ